MGPVLLGGKMVSGTSPRTVSALDGVPSEQLLLQGVALALGWAPLQLWGGLLCSFGAADLV